MNCSHNLTTIGEEYIMGKEFTGMLLDINKSDNTWIPPEIDARGLALSLKNDMNAQQSMEYLHIFKVVPYIDSIYIEFDADRKLVVIKRFAIHEGYRWSIDDEEFFHSHCITDESCGYSGGVIEQIYSLYSEIYPDWHLKRYYTKGLRLIDHIYSCSQKNNLKEILYKSDLDELAAGIHRLDELSLFASRPSDIYDGLSMKVLRSVNCHDGAVLLANKDDRSFLKELNMKFPELFKSKLNDAQCRYLSRLIKGNLTVGEAGRLFESRRDELSRIWCRSFYDIFIDGERRRQKKDELCRTFSDLDPIYENYIKNAKSPYDAFDDMEIAQLELYLFVKREEYDKAIRRSNRKREYDWMERGKDYYIRYPQTINDFCREAVYMQSCLLTYVEAYINNDTTILFMRRTEDTNKPFITIEIYKGELMQAYHRFNSDCTDEEAAYIRDYCVRHGIGLGKFKFNYLVDELF